MTIADLAEHVQFTVDRNVKITSVVIPPELWQQILDALEDVEDRALVESLRARLVVGPATAGALRWQDIAADWQ